MTRSNRDTRKQIVVAGNGMVGFRFCRELVERAGDSVAITVYADEDRPAYDRIHLTRMLGGAKLDELMLAPRSWYEQNRIDLRLGDPVVAIDRRQRRVRTRSGREQSYDHLVVATGAEPRLPAITGCDLPSVFVYRSAADVLSIKLRSRRAGSAAVLGGGLLGLEAARALCALGVETYVVESAPHLLPRQLDPSSAEILRRQVEELGIQVAVDCRVTEIREGADLLVVEVDGWPPLAVDLVVIAAGVRPRDALARDAGLVVSDVHGGIAIDDHTRTSDPRILAIGDCACHAGRTYGLVGPGYQMARVAADHIAGGNATFTGADASCRLQVAGIEVASLGEPSADGSTAVYEEGAIRRALALRGDQLVGLRAIGPWPELLAVDRAIAERRRVTALEIDRFCRTGELWPPAPTAAVSDDEALACQCARVSCGQVRAHIARGCASVAAIGAATGAGTVCGSCQPVLVQLLGQRDDKVAPVRRPRLWPMVAASAVALAGCAAFLALGPWSVDGDTATWIEWLSRFWRDGADKKLSGFVLAGMAALGLLLPLRNRIAALRRRRTGWVRSFHTIVGAGALAMLVVHTGMHMGDNLNRALLVSFLALLASGAVVGLASAAVGRARARAALARRARACALWGHWALFGVLPVLLAFHIVAVYYF